MVASVRVNAVPIGRHSITQTCGVEQSVLSNCNHRDPKKPPQNVFDTIPGYCIEFDQKSNNNDIWYGVFKSKFCAWITLQ